MGQSWRAWSACAQSLRGGVGQSTTERGWASYGQRETMTCVDEAATILNRAGAWVGQSRGVQSGQRQANWTESPHPSSCRDREYVLQRVFSGNLLPQSFPLQHPSLESTASPAARQYRPPHRHRRHHLPHPHCTHVFHLHRSAAPHVLAELSYSHYFPYVIAIEATE